MKELEKAAKNYADTMYRFEDRGVLYQETQNDFKAGANYLKSLLLEKLQVYKGAMILDGYDPEDSCIKFMNELIEEINEGEYSSWISVEKRLPKPGVEVLLFDKDSIRHYVTGWLREKKKTIKICGYFLMGRRR